METLYLLEFTIAENIYGKSRKDTQEGNTSHRTELNYKTSQGRGVQHSPICVNIPLKKKKWLEKLECLHTKSLQL